jgi:hypothetical protein
MVLAYCKTTGSIKLGSSFLTLPTRGLIGHQQIMSSDGGRAGLPIAGPDARPQLLSHGWSLGLGA